MRVVVVLVLLAACGGGSKHPPASAPLSASWTAPSMLVRVPAESPYLMAMIDPMPESQKRQMFAALDEKLARALALYETVRTNDRSKLPAEQRVAFAFFDELHGKSLEHWGRDLGFDSSSRFVFYGLSVWPVVRVAVANETRVREVITKMLAAGAAPVNERVLRGKRYWQFGDAKFSAIASIAGGEAIFAVLPTPAIAQYLPVVLGLERPPHTLAEGRQLADITERYHFMPSMVGYVDTRRVADILTQRAPSAGTELDKPLAAGVGTIEQSCRDDVDRLVASVPRMVFGYHELDTRRMHGSLVLELAPDLTASLERLRTAVPELPVGSSAPGVVGFGIGLRLGELLALLDKLTRHIHDSPFACSWFKGLNGAAAELAHSLDRPLPPVLLGFRGLSIVIDDLKKGPAFDITGHAVLVGDHANDLLGILLKLVPGMAGIVVPPDGRPVQLPLAGLGVAPGLNAYAATHVDRAAIAVGASSPVDVVHALALPPPARSPLMSFSFDAQRMVQLGWLKPEDAGTMRAVTLQLDVLPSGLSLEVFDVFAAH